MDAPVQRPLQAARGNVPHVADTLGKEFADDASAAGQELDRIFGRRRCAVRAERAGVRIGALGADLDRGLVAQRHSRESGVRPARYLGQQLGDPLAEVDVAQQPAVIAAAGVDEGRVDVCQDGARHRVTGRVDHPGLHRAVDQVAGLHPGRRLDLGKLEAGADFGEDIRAHQHATGAEGRLEQRVLRLSVEVGRGALERRVERDVGPDQHAVRDGPVHQVVEPAALGKPTSGLGVVNPQLGTIDLEPEPSPALAAGHDTGFRQPVGQGPGSPVAGGARRNWAAILLGWRGSRRRASG